MLIVNIHFVSYIDQYCLLLCRNRDDRIKNTLPVIGREENMMITFSPSSAL